jgi:type IV secretory pathway protease TraF
MESSKNYRFGFRPLHTIKVHEYLSAMVGVAVSGFVIWAGLFVLPVMWVKDASMQPTIPPGSLVWILPTIKIWAPQKGEIVITALPQSVISYLQSSPKYRARFKEKSPEIVLLKRIAAVPGERVSWQGKSIVLGPTQYWVEGDNKGKSIDSRSKFFGPIPQSDILGRAYLVWKSGETSHE